jgi:hypothetical protein
MGKSMRTRIAAIVLAAIPFLVAMGFLLALVSSTGPEGWGVIVAFLYTSIALTVLGFAAIILAFLKREPSALDIPSRVVSIISVVCFAPPAGFGLILGIMMLFPPAVNV